MANFVRHYVQDLQKKISLRIDGSLTFSGDNLSTQIEVEVLDGGAAATLSGTVVGYAIRADGGTVVMTGTLSGNTVSVILPEAALAYIGPLAVSIQLVSSGVKTTLLKVAYNVDEISTGTTIDPGTVVPSLADILAELDDMAAATAAAESAAEFITMLAPNESTSTASRAYSVGEYLVYNETLYRVTAAISSGGTITPGTNCTAVTVGGELADLKSAFDSSMNLAFEKHDLRVLNTRSDRAISSSGQEAYSAGNTITNYSITPGSLIIATVASRSGDTYPYTYGFYTGADIISTNKISISSDALNNDILVVPQNAVGFAISTAGGVTTNSVKVLIPKSDKIDEIISPTQTYLKTDGSDIPNSIYSSGYYGNEPTTTSIRTTALSGYNAVIIPVTKDTHFYFDSSSSLFRFNTIEEGTITESSGSYTITGKDAKNYNSGSLPTSSSKALVHKGGYVIVTATIAQTLAVNMSFDILMDDILLNTRQISQAKRSTISELGFAVKSASCIYADNVLRVFIPTGNGYVRYDFKHGTDPSINADIWRIDNAYAVDDDYVEQRQLTSSGEWECALHLEDRDDFSGGMSHGDEVVQDITFLLDGSKVSTSDLTTRKKFKELRIVELSNMYDPEDHTTEICTHGSEHVFNENGLTINQNVIWAGSFSTTTCYMAMFPAKKNGDDKVYMDTNYALETLPSSNYRNVYNGAKSVTIFSDTADYCSVFEVPKYVNLSGGDVLWILDNGGSNYHKMYYVVTTGKYVTNGEIWKTQTKYKIDVGS